MAWQQHFDGDAEEWPDLDPGAAVSLPADLAPAERSTAPSSLLLSAAPAPTGTVRSTESQPATTTGTLVLHDDADGANAGAAGPSQLAWAVAAAKGAAPGGGKVAAPRDIFSPLKLETMFNPPTLPRARPATEPPTPFEPRSSTPRSSEAGTLPEPELPSLQSHPFTFTATRDQTSWRSRPHFLGNDPVAEVPSSQVSFEDTPSRPPVEPKAQPQPQPQLKLFQFTYDTYTRSHLEALVDEIDHFADTGAGPSRTADEDDEPHWRNSVSNGDFVEAAHDREDELEDDERPITRSAKRIRLSPVHERSSHDFLVAPTTLPRSAVRDRIRARRVSGATEDPTISPTLSRSYSRRPIATPTVVPPTPSASSVSGMSGADRVNARLQQAQALMDRIRLNVPPPPEASLSSTLTSSQARSSPMASASSSGGATFDPQPGPPVPAYDPPPSAWLGAPLPPVLEAETEDETAVERSFAPLPNRPRNPTPLHAAGAFRTTSQSTGTGTGTVQTARDTLGVRTASESTTLTTAHSVGSQLKRSAESNQALAEQLRTAAAAQVEAALRLSLAESPRPFGRTSSQRALGLSPSNSRRSLGVGQPSQVPAARSTSDEFGTRSTGETATAKQPHPSIITIAPHQIQPNVIDTAAAHTRMVYDAHLQRWVRAVPDTSEEDIFQDIENFSASAVVPTPNDEGDGQDDDDETAPIADDGDFTDEQPTLPPPVVPIIALPPESPDQAHPLSGANPMLSTPGPERPPLRPRSALKSRSDPLLFPTPGAGRESTPRSDSSSPPDSAKRRSVSFSDRRIHFPRAVSEPLAGPSRLRHEIRPEPTGSIGDEDADEDEGAQTPSEPSPLSKNSNVGAGGSSGDMSSRTHRIETAMADVKKLSLAASEDSDGSVFTSRQPSMRSRGGGGGPGTGRPRNADATFLTECSFGVAHDRLIVVLTDVHPFEPNWASLATIDLSHKKLTGVVRLKEMLPQLDELDLSHNEIAYLTGIPDSLRTLRLGHNVVSSLASFGHLVHLQRLDLSSNDLDSVKQLGCLRHLRELKADNNRIDDLTGLSEIDGLVQLSLKNNRLARLDLCATKWSRLESLNVSANAIVELVGLERTTSLISLNLDGNRLESFGGKPVSTLRILRVCDNPLSSLDVLAVPGLRTLVADRCRLKTIPHLGRLPKLETICLGGQTVTSDLHPHAIRDVRRLLLAGTALHRTLFGRSEPFYSLVQLDLSSCRLSKLPVSLVQHIPACRSLLLDANFLVDLEAVRGLTRLRRLSATGNRLVRLSALADVVATLPELRALDLRSNRCTLSFYGPGPSEDDAAFVRTLPNAWLMRRTAYRAAILRASPTLRKLDGLKITVDGERKTATKSLEWIERATKAQGWASFAAFLDCED